LTRLKTLFEDPRTPAFELSPGLRARYDGDLELTAPIVYANFVASIDGVVARQDVGPALISRHSTDDRFVMGLLRTFADAVVVGASTLRAEPKGLWTPQYIYPDAAAELSELREKLGLPESPQLVVLTRSGDLDPTAPALRRGGLIITGERGKDRLAGDLPETCRIVSLGADPTVSGALKLLRSDGCRSILAEGGPHVLGQMMRDQAVDEIFLTISAVLVGRSPVRHGLGLVEGFAFEPSSLPSARLMSLKASGSDLFLRYKLSGQTSGGPLDRVAAAEA
jgi:riboflavin biosynthesis pyrimidine reductase